MVSLCIHGLRHWRQIACAGIGATLLSVLLMAAPANAETSDAISAPTSPPAAEITASVEQVGTAPVEPAPVEEVETAATPSAANEVDVPAEPAEVVSEVEDVASAPPSSVAPRATSSTPPVKDIVSSVPSPGEATRSASAAVPVDVPSGTEPAAVDPNAITDRIVKEAREVSVPERNVAALVDGVRQHSTETIAAATGRLTASSGELALPSGPLTPAISAGAEEGRPPAAAPVVTETRSDRPAPFPSLQRRSGLLPSPKAVELRPGLGEYLSDAGVLDIAKAPGPAPHHWGIGLSPRTEIGETAPAGPRDSRLGGPSAPELPPPAPQSPVTAVGDTGGPSSVPVVALLALLALVAPAARRRLGEVAAFRPPTPFVCALERPG
jgi:MYXO-CTERM domain-containing protein